MLQDVVFFWAVSCVGTDVCFALSYASMNVSEQHFLASIVHESCKIRSKIIHQYQLSTDYTSCRNVSVWPCICFGLPQLIETLDWLVKCFESKPTHSFLFLFIRQWFMIAGHVLDAEHLSRVYIRTWKCLSHFICSSMWKVAVAVIDDQTARCGSNVGVARMCIGGSRHYFPWNLASIFECIRKVGLHRASTQQTLHTTWWYMQSQEGPWHLRISVARINSYRYCCLRNIFWRQSIHQQLYVQFKDVGSLHFDELVARIGWWEMDSVFDTW